MKHEDLTQRLLTWYDSTKRDLPWRIHPDPYHILVSEIMLQQTRMETVLPYFERFVNQLPDISSLAKVDDDLLYKLWQGLGYYRRATNLKKAAQMIMTDFDGILPQSKSELMTLPGIGEYTSGAIASTAFQQCEIAVDGNVKRVIARLVGIRASVSDPNIEREIRTIVLDHQPKNRPGDYNQALMELGALVCLPSGTPRCDVCPWQNDCVTSQAKDFDLVPLKAVKASRKAESKTIVILQYSDMVFLHKRAAKGLLANLWEFLTLDGILSLEEVHQLVLQSGFSVQTIRELPKRNHVFSHIEWRMIGFYGQCASTPSTLVGQFVPIEDVTTHYSIPTAFRGYYDDLLMINGIPSPLATRKDNN